MTAQGETRLPANASLGSVNGGPGVTGRETLTFHLAGGLGPLREADPSLVAEREVAFAGAVVTIPTLAREASLTARGSWRGADGAERGFEAPLTLAPRDRNLVMAPPRYDGGTGEFGIPPHPGGHLHPLEDGALHAWATGERVVAIGPGGKVEPPGPEWLDLLVLTGMGGGVLRVEAS